MNGEHSIPVQDVWLDREGDYIVVRIKKGGRWYLAIREHAPGESHFSHNITSYGIEQLDEPILWLEEQAHEGEGEPGSSSSSTEGGGR